MECRDWEEKLSDEERYIWELIKKSHSYYSEKDKSYKRTVRCIKVSILSLGMISTIILGLKDIIDTNIQLVCGLIISSVITFVTAVGSYFNFEEYWMRNIKIHIELNIIRDNFMYDVKKGNMDRDKLDDYWIKLKAIQEKNIEYWNMRNN